MTINDAKAIGRCLTDFNSIRELNISETDLNTETTQEIADGLMMAKKLEIFKVSGNKNMGEAVSSIIYNLAFSPKIRHIDLSDTSNDRRAKHLDKMAESL